MRFDDRSTLEDGDLQLGIPKCEPIQPFVGAGGLGDPLDDRLDTGPKVFSGPEHVPPLLGREAQIIRPGHDRGDRIPLGELLEPLKEEIRTVLRIQRRRSARRRDQRGEEEDQRDAEKSTGGVHEFASGNRDGASSETALQQNVPVGEAATTGRSW